MRWQVESSVLAGALKKVIPFAGGHLPVTTGVRIEAGDNSLTLECQNADQKATTTLVAHVDEAGVCVVPARLFDGFIRSLSGKILAEIRDDMFGVVCGSTSLSLHMLAVDDWPKFAEPDGDPFDLSAFWPGVRRVLHAAGANRERPILTGVHFSAGVVAATDSYRLAAFTVEGLEANANVPAVLLAQVDKAVKDQLEVTFGDRAVKFSTGDTSWTSRLIEGEYPAWKSLVRDKSAHTLTFTRSELAETLDRLRLISDDNGYRRLKFTRDGDKAIFTTIEQDHGEITDVISCGGDWADPFSAEIPYLSDLIDNCSGDEITFGMEDSGKPLIVRDGDWTGLCMPARIS